MKVIAEVKNQRKSSKQLEETTCITCKGATSILTTDFSTENIKTRRQQNDVLQLLKENNYLPRREKSFKNEGKIKIFSAKQKWKEIIKKYTQAKIKMIVFRHRVYFRWINGNAEKILKQQISM